MENWKQGIILAERLKRQGLAHPLVSPGDEDAYKTLFRRLQPVAPVHFTRPGDPPRLVHRTVYPDFGVSSAIRERGELVKARFQGGRIAYVLEEDLKLYATAFKKEMTRSGNIHQEILALIQESGGLSKDQLKEELPYRAGDIGKALEELQKAFILYEQQTDTDWDTGWLDFAGEWFEIPGDPESRLQAMEEVVLRFTEAMVFATEAQMKSWSGWTGKQIRALVEGLVEQGRLIRTEVEGWGTGVICEGDPILTDRLAAGSDPSSVPKRIWMLDKSDFLVRTELDELKKRYEGREVLQYLLVDGVFQGAVTGHWGFKDYDIEDIILDLPEEEVAARRDEAISAVREVYDSKHHAILRYNGIPL
ncbi:winged helix DNA-binding domain-containing protein [Paenibacillus sp. Marseille-P2973]|uniref:DNA glycosylase AlkZ-like family protein n=1 Tax=Paenibacillus sp. Marseille-P2973 TaxID=1871032 RepID=UPI001B360C87|nr:crosslink repair DNA glycosylase YcaQ family protein [Paenibacillus sp. Marseille-P2973]MBQ4898628.1 winged helix DNA-binding domain-containing protein [Paenibacillus sp. Marseille-P2973]